MTNELFENKKELYEIYYPSDNGISMIKLDLNKLDDNCFLKTELSKCSKYSIESLINDKFMSSNVFNSNDFNEANNYLEEEKKLNLKDNDLNYILSDNNNNFENKESKNLFHNNYYYHDLNLLNNDSEEEMIILNLCNYHVSGKLGGMMNKYMNKEDLIKNNYDFNNNKDSLLEHKYGGNSLNNDDEKNNYNERSTYNIEEEFPNKLIKHHN